MTNLPTLAQRVKRDQDRQRQQAIRDGQQPARIYGGQAARRVYLPVAAADVNLPRAACKGEDPELWFSDDPADQAEAFGICAGCPEQPGCQAKADALGVEHGIWAGIDRSDRTVASDAE